MYSSVFKCGYELQILNVIVCLIPIYVVDLIAIWDFAKEFLPYYNMLKFELALVYPYISLRCWFVLIFHTINFICFSHAVHVVCFADGLHFHLSVLSLFRCSMRNRMKW